MELQNAHRPNSRSGAEDKLVSGAPVRFGFWVLAIVAAFGVGNLLGALHYGTSPLSLVTIALFPATEDASDPSGPIPTVIHESDLAQLEPEATDSSKRAGDRAKLDFGQEPSSEQSNRKLRLRSISRLSSASAQAGERVTFVTAEAIEDACGRTVPAGAVVQGVISHATSSSKAGAGKLVIEIHSMQTGRRSLTLSALPLAAIAISSNRSNPPKPGVDAVSDPLARTARAPRPDGSGLLRRTINNLNEAPAWVRSRVTGSPSVESILGLLPEVASGNANRGTHEAVVPKETVLEFELITLPSGGPRSMPPAESQSSPESEPQPRRAPAWQHLTPRTSHS